MTCQQEYDDYKKKNFIKILFCIIENINNDGSLGSSDYENWKCIMTTLALDLFLSCGISTDTIWFTKNNKKLVFTDLIQFLNNQIQDSGEFGEDFWDACRLGLVINEYSLFDKFSNYQKLHNYIIRYIQSDCYNNDKSSAWYGPAFYAISIDYIDSIKIIDVNLSNLANTIYDKLVKLQHQNGSYMGSTNKLGIVNISPIWHTFQVLQTHIRRGIAQSDTKITSIISWITSAQEDDGSFRDYRYTIMCTSYIIQVLSKLDSCKEIVNKGLMFLHNSIINNKLDSSEICMIGLALRSVENSKLYFNVTLLDINNLETLESHNYNLSREVAQYKTELQQYKTTYKDVGIVLSKVQSWVLGIVASLLISTIFFLLDRVIK